MSILSYFFEAFILGFVVAAIVGPICMLCIKKTLELGFGHGIAVGLGASFADGFYGLVVGAGMTAVSGFLLDNTFHIKLISGVFLLYLAYKEIRQKDDVKLITSSSKSFFMLLWQSFFLTAANPLTILVFLPIFTNISGGNVTLGSAAAMTAGVFIGSLVWWVILCALIHKIKHNLPARFIYRIRLISAVTLACFGIWSIYDLF